MSKIIKALGLVFLGLIIWTALVYIAFAFLKAEANPFIWQEEARGGMLFLVVVYAVFGPLMVMALKEEM